MSEEQSIKQMIKPNTRSSLHKDFLNLGLEKGMTVIVHTSLSSLGWVCGGPTAVIQALMDIIGEEGTIVMPTQTPENSDPSTWQMPPVPKDWWPIIREEMPAFDPNVTPVRGMGVIAETFRKFPEVSRSNHPTYSFAAWGKEAGHIISEQPLSAGFGSKSPLAKIYELDGHILLLGVGHDSNTSLHFAEHYIEDREKVKKGTAMFENGTRIWKTYKEIDYDSDQFEALGKEFEDVYEVNCENVGIATSKLIGQRLMVDFARDWLQKKNG
ncbi:aminoglycoside N(3)-acetyltransferase [Aquibacillus halophilus]|uniref:Aminoglycoside N(3)-acetyltransferase n=1 Tax=Aquibacillus halophilus TaxID=930132 RepID=A0A6A8DHF4_9BACI|nr:AAC(3) family N-acetyltransferase [Aquibacillus halophilus]MRH43926.1 aminoglycoside N(3)-acetyltransferase [Aquibacillus halophilus]